jgi:hypothetical protein
MQVVRPQDIIPHRKLGLALRAVDFLLVQKADSKLRVEFNEETLFATVTTLSPEGSIFDYPSADWPLLAQYYEDARWAVTLKWKTSGSTSPTFVFKPLNFKNSTETARLRRERSWEPPKSEKKEVV